MKHLRKLMGKIMNRLNCRSITSIGVLIFLVNSLGAKDTPQNQFKIRNIELPLRNELWFLDETAAIQNHELVLDGRKSKSSAYYKIDQWGDVTLSAKFKVDPMPNGVLACGFVVRASDRKSYYYVHFDRTQAILVRSDPDKNWNEIKRATGLKKPSNQWHSGILQIKGSKLTVSLNDTELFSANNDILKKGRIGFYANQGLVRVSDIVVSGTPTRAPKTFTTPPNNYVLVCTDAGAGGYEAFPDVCRMKDGRLICVFYAGYGHVALPNNLYPKGGRIAYCISENEGRTWSASKTLLDTPYDDRDPSITQLSDGRLICSYFNLRENIVDGSYNVGTWITISSDAGKNWSRPQLIQKGYACSSPIRELSSGRLILGLYKERNRKANGAVAISDNSGSSWRSPIIIDNIGAYLDAETDVIELEDGKLYAAMRGGQGADMHWATSSDMGGAWTKSESIGFPAHCPYLHRCPNGTIVMGTRIPATSIRLSKDECKTWSESFLVDSHTGAYPSIVNLNDNTSLIVYYEEGEGSNIRAKRFQTDGASIHWLPLK